MISFTVHSVPVAQPRQRHRSFQMGPRIITQNYTPEKHPVNAFKADVRAAAQKAYQGAPLEGPISLRLVFVLPRPQKYCRKKDDPGRLWCYAKPDSDNLEKAVKDALSKIVWRDDAQACRIIKSKFYAARDEQPHVEIELGVIES